MKTTRRMKNYQEEEEEEEEKKDDRGARQTGMIYPGWSGYGGGEEEEMTFPWLFIVFHEGCAEVSPSCLEHTIRFS